MSDPAQIMAEMLGPDGQFPLTREEVLGVEMTVFADRPRSTQQLLAESAKRGDALYLVTTDERRITYAQHASMAASLGQRLRDDHGVAPGDRVAILGANSPEWIVAFWAAQWAGAVAVAYNAWWSADEIAYGVGHTTPKVVLADAKRRDRLADSGVDVAVLSLEDDVPALADASAGFSPSPASAAEDDPATILYTSGTTGRPKGVVHTHRNLCAVTMYHGVNDAMARAMGMPDDPPRLDMMLMPLFHIGSLHNLAVARLAAGTGIAVYEGRFDVDRVLSFIEREKITNWGAVPTMAHRMIEHPSLGDYDLSSLRQFALASAPSSPAFKARLREALPIAQLSLADSYGLTETSTAVAVASPMDLQAHPTTMGRPIVSVELEIRDSAGRSLPAGEEGEIWVRSQFNMLEYYGDPDATAKAITADRWLATGDLGRLDDEGRLFLQTRRSDLIIRGGENVYPAEVEGALEELDGVRECLVAGIDDEDLGQRVAAVVVVHAESGLDEQRLREHAEQRLAYFKVPDRWHVTTQALPRNATGKVVRGDALQQAHLA